MLPCSLEVINLENNQIIKIQSNTFVQCQQLKEINLKGNPMAPEVSAPEYVFRPLRFLRSVSIDWDEDGYERERTKVSFNTDESYRDELSWFSLIKDLTAWPDMTRRC